jgi:biotin transport system substrate-specific component
MAISARPRLVLADLIPGDRVRDTLVVLGYAGLVGRAAQLSARLPFTPIPPTGQTFAVLLGGPAAGTRRGAAGMVLFMVAGMIRVPWFAGGLGGFSILASPGVGYIVGFSFAAAVLGMLARRGFERHPLPLILALVAGNAVVYAFSATWLALRLHPDRAQALALESPRSCSGTP